MHSKSLVILFIFSFFSCYYIDLQAQKISKSYEIKWKQPIEMIPYDDFSFEILNFENAICDDVYPSLPLYFDKIAVDNFYDTYNIIVSNVKKAAFTEHEISLIPKDFFQNEVVINIYTGIENKKNYAMLSFIPIIKNENGVYEKIVSCDITIIGNLSKEKIANQGKNKNYATNSILANGKWYKVSVVESGMHKITFADFQSLGISVSLLNSNQIGVFGNGGRMLPEANSTERYDDLQEIPIGISDGGDGTFDDGDYIYFYAQGPHTWSYSEDDNRFVHSFNIYSEHAYYFINIDAGIGEKRRINIVDNNSLSANYTASTFTHYQFYEKDAINFGESGRYWFDEGFDYNATKEYSFSIPQMSSSSGILTISAATNSTIPSYFDVSINNTVLPKMGLNTAYGSHLVMITDKMYSINTTLSPAKIQLTYSKPQASCIAYLDWIEFQAECELSSYSDQFPFVNIHNAGTGNNTLYQIRNCNNSTKIWNISNPTNPYQMEGTLNNSQFIFTDHNDSLQYYIAFNDNSFKSITTIGQVSNQNLHGSSMADLIIVSHPDFFTQAEELAKYKREKAGLSVRVVSPAQIYNEFSSGAQDPTAIRDYMKMIYDKSNGNYPQYLLLIGRPSYDYRGVVEGTQIFVPNYQSNVMPNESYFRANDDYFGLLDENEGDGCSSGLLDIAVGRFPVTSSLQTENAVKQIINYSSNTELVSDNSSTISNFADWKNMVTIVADDEDNNCHITTADAAASNIQTVFPNYNFDKIYCDAYQQTSSAGGQRYPEVTLDINNRMNRGSMLFIYVGHGSGSSWAHERILEVSDINKWTNKYCQPLVITLTCEFGWYDRKATSPAELMFFNTNGGATAMITTSRVAFTGSNDTYARTLSNIVFSQINNRNITVGEINKLTKNNMGGINSSTNMIYVMGDPSLQLKLPQYKIVTDSINGVSITQNIDTLKALSKVTISGRITDNDGNILNDFNGNIYPSIFDKPLTINTLQNDEGSDVFEFTQQKSILFKGNASVKNGKFSFSFFVPKDINYVYGKGKFSFYAKNTTSDAAGYSNDCIIGGYSNNPIIDNRGPEISVYLNNESFVSGGIIDPNPELIVHLKDEFGINTTGNGIGHDLTAIIDGKTESQIILNDYYQTEQDSFNCGKVRYNLENLEEGNHTLKVRAWDISNNYNETEINFKVVSDASLTIDHLLNYPNPFTTHTDFYFEQNQAGQTFDILITIFTISGKKVKTIQSTQDFLGNRCDPIAWDGRDDFGDRLAKGVYIYKISIRNSEGEKAEKIEKLVIL